jgi:lipid II:glycine glycyltransferase (peptidoglycan interpeptide bridge formation enzyme)
VADIREALGQKWRNQLNVSERKGLSLNISSAKREVEWMLKRQQEHMKEKGFKKGISIAFLEALYNASPMDFIVLQALVDNQPVSGITIFKHGHSAHYLIGWFGPVGRSCNAGNFLLWNAVLIMKQQGCRWLDVGGYSTDGYGHFKRGMRGCEYKHVGNCICF